MSKAPAPSPRALAGGPATVIRRLAPYLRPHRALVAGSFVSLLAAIALRLLEPWPLKLLFDEVIVVHARGGGGAGWLAAQPPLAALLLIAAATIAIASLRALAEFLNTTGFARIGNRALTALRSDLFRHLQRLSLAFHHRARSGDLVLRLMSDVNLLRDAAVTAVMPLAAGLLMLAGMIAVMLAMNLPLALLALVTLPLFAAAASRLGARIRVAAGAQRKREGALAASAAESIAAIKIVQALSLEERFAASFAARSDRAGGEDVKVSRLSARLERSVDVLIAVSTALVIVYGGRLVLTGAITPGELLVFFTYLKRAFNPVQDFAKYTGRLAKAVAAGGRVLEVLDHELAVADRTGAVAAPPLSGAVRFERLSFAYEPGLEVLSGIDVAVSPGERVALVGPSGIGKSTLVSLLLRLYDPTAGRVLVDGCDIRDYTLRSLRSQVAVVLQETVLFAASVWENIGLGSETEDREAVLAAATLANADEFIRRLPQGYETILGERGATLSGGERQRIAIARAAIRRAPLLILDEPTTGLDEANERAVVEALERLAAGRTTFVISHDLRMAARADRILYLEGGAIVEQGSHAELLRAGGRYAALWRLREAAGGADRPREDAHASRA